MICKIFAKFKANFAKDDMKNVEVEWPDDDSAIAAGATKHLFGADIYDVDS